MSDDYKKRGLHWIILSKKDNALKGRVYLTRDEAEADLKFHKDTLPEEEQEQLDWVIETRTNEV